MRAFAWRHPSLMTAWYAALWLLTEYLFMDAREWWWKALLLAANFGYFLRAGKWYGRTGGPAA